MEMVCSGTVRNTVDDTGMFGAGIGGGVLDGKAFTAGLPYGSATGTVSSTAVRNQLFGGTSFAAVSPFVSGAMTINGVSIDLRVMNRFIVTDTSQSYGSAAAVYAEKVGVVVEPVKSVFDVSVDAGAGAIPLGLDVPCAMTPINSVGRFSFFQGNPFAAGFLYRVDGQIIVSSLTVREYVRGAVPLPTSGVMLLGAVAGIAALRRKRRASG